MDIDTLLLTKVHSLFRFPQFSPNVHFLFHDSIQGTRVHLVFLCFQAPLWLWQFLQNFLVFKNLDSFEYWSDILQDVPLLGFFVVVFLMVRLGLWIMRKSAVLITYQACMLSTLLMTVDAGLGYLAKVVFVRFLHCSIILLSCLSILYCLKVTQELKTKEWKVMLPQFEMEHLYKLFRILL